MFPWDNHQGAIVVDSYQTQLLSSSSCGGDVVMLELERPAGYQFAAGQWFRMVLSTTTGDEARIFSHASSPDEQRLLMATRLSSSAFKQALGRLQPGDVATIQGPGGRLALPESSSRIVFLTGGVGVTPVRSMLRAAAHAGKIFEDALVLYGSRTQDCVPYLADLQALGPNGVRVVQVVERPDSEWAGERGFIDADMVRRHVADVADLPFVVTGPPPMVAAMEGVMGGLGVAQSQRLIERFTAPSAPLKSRI